MNRRHARSRRFSFGAFTGSGFPAPVVASIYPALGLRRASGLAVTISGTGFQPGAGVTINGLSATSVVVASSTTITCVTPTFAGDGAFDVAVTNLDTQSNAKLAAYTVWQSAAWWKQGLGVTLDGSSKVQTWADQSGNGNDAPQPTAGSRAAVLAAYRNGKTAIDCTGGKHFISSATSIISGGAPLTLLYAGNGGGLTGALFTMRIAATFVSLDIFRFAVNNVYICSDSSGGLISAPISDAVSASDQYNIYEFPDRVGANVKYMFNGVQQTTAVVAAIATENGTTGFYIGNNPSNQTLSMKCLELVVVAGNATAAQKAAWNAYCRTEYNFP